MRFSDFLRSVIIVKYYGWLKKFYGTINVSIAKVDWPRELRVLLRVNRRSKCVSTKKILSINAVWGVFDAFFC